MELITNMLLLGELKPSDKIPTETEFAQKMRVGRSSFREAIKTLTSLGVVEIRRGVRSIYCKEISSPAINSLILSLVFEKRTTKELIELRLLLNMEAADLVLERINDEDIG